VGVSSETLRNAVAYAIARDCVVVGAAGNFNSSQSYFPAAYDGVLSVGASDHAFKGSFFLRVWGPGDIDGRAPYSEFGASAVDVVAPGTVFNAGVLSVADAAADSDLRPGLLAGFSAGGTSFSAPLVSGLAALVISRDKDLNGGVRTLRADEVVGIVEATAHDLGDDPFDFLIGSPGGCRRVGTRPRRRSSSTPAVGHFRCRAQGFRLRALPRSRDTGSTGPHLRTLL
jgi:subtilisin family serine protease